MPNDIHTIELKEAVLHRRICIALGIDVPYIVALSPSNSNLAGDLCAYDKLSGALCKLSTAKINYKRLLRAYCAMQRTTGVLLDMAITVNAPFGVQKRIMTASMPAIHATRAEAFFLKCLHNPGDVESLYSEDFDPYIVLGLLGLSNILPV